jgi:hypothetical protein
MTQFTCKGVKQTNNRISLNMTFTFTIRISRRFSSAREFQMGISRNIDAKCRSRFFCTSFFSRAEDFESWWKGPSKSGEKCSRRKVHMYATSTSLLALVQSEVSSHKATSSPKSPSNVSPAVRTDNKQDWHFFSHGWKISFRL